MSTSETSRGEQEYGPIYFWREYEHPYGFLSQWHTSAFVAPPFPNTTLEESQTFLTTEQYMMYQKAIVFEDDQMAAKILKESSPEKQRALGRKVANFDNKTWDKVKEKVVEEGNFWKFTQDKEDAEGMRKKLLDTGDRLLVEASPFDKIWGVGYGASNAGAHKSSWGQNLLGKALMRVRERLREGHSQPPTADAEAAT